MTSAPIRWGCVGTGNIAMAMAQQLSRIPGAHKEAICSASGKPAASVKDKCIEFGYSRAVSFEKLISDPAIDAVYVASANTAHAKHCLAALRGGKHVLCEKPLTMTADEADTLFSEANQRQVLLVEGTFSAYLPAFGILRAHIADIGKVTRVELNKKIRMAIMQSSPIINRRSLGGGLFDGCGSYTFHTLCVIFGADAIRALDSADIHVVTTPDPSGEVDWDTTVSIKLCGASVILTHRAMDEALPSVVTGEKGTIEFTLPRLEDITVNGQHFKTPYGHEGPFADLSASEPGAPHGVHRGLGVEAFAMHRALSAGLVGPGTPELPLDVMQAMAHAMDLVRHQIPTHVHYKPQSNM